MAERLIFRPVASDELVEAVAWYLAANPQAADDFRAAVRGVFDEIAAYPLRWPFAHLDIREAPVPGFPYSVHYKHRPGRVVVLSVFHNARDPAIWQARA